MKETINKILHKIRHTKGLEHLLELSFGCRAKSEDGYEFRCITKNSADEPFWLSEDDVHTKFMGDFEIIGHTVQWSDVLIAMEKVSSDYSLSSLGYFEKWEKYDSADTFKLTSKPNLRADLTKTPEQNMEESPELTAFLADLLLKE